MKLKITALVLMGFFIASCSEGGNVKTSGKKATEKREAKKAQPFQPPPAMKRVIDVGKVARGERIFLENCSECHGKNAEGDQNWREKGDDGKYPPPPLNGTAHAWHHPNKGLQEYVKFGSRDPKGNMKGFEGKLSEEEIDDAIAFFQSKWSEDIYSAWASRDQEARKRQKQ